MNCAAVVETLLEAELFGIQERTATGVRGRRGKFEHADEGTLFLDEVSDNDSMRAWASRYARLVFERCGRNKRQASRLLDISYHTLDAYLRYGNTGSRPAGKRVPAWARAEPCEPAV